jgi:CspA family cold shock protein
VGTADVARSSFQIRDFRRSALSFMNSPFFYRATTAAAVAADRVVDAVVDMGAQPLDRLSRPASLSLAGSTVTVTSPFVSKVVDNEIVQETGRVKFFDPVKGFGFVISDETGDEIFMRAGCLQVLGLQTIAPGSTVLFEAEEIDKGPVVVRIIAVDETTASERAKQATPAAGPLGSSKHGFGRVTVWKDDKGYGFVETDDGDSVFVHVSKHGGIALHHGSRVEITYRLGEKSYAADWVREMTSA